MTTTAAAYAYKTTARPDRSERHSVFFFSGRAAESRVASQAGGSGAASSRSAKSAPAASVHPAQRAR